MYIVARPYNNVVYLYLIYGYQCWAMDKKTE